MFGDTIAARVDGEASAMDYPRSCSDLPQKPVTCKRRAELA